MQKRLPPKTGRRVEEKKPQEPVPDDGKPQLRCKEEPAVHGFVVEDEDQMRLDYELSRLKEALPGIADPAFYDGLLHQLKRLFPFEDGPDSMRNFDFVLAVLKDAKPVDALHANVVFQMAVGQIAITRQFEILLKPIRPELPSDVAVAMHRAAWDAGRMEPQKIKIADQPVRLMVERMLTRLMQTNARLLQVSTAYKKAFEAARHEAQKKAPARFSRRLNGSRQCAVRISGSSKEQMNAIQVRKTNGRASS